jgi:hydroxyacylglutathione hydrolase
VRQWTTQGGHLVYEVVRGRSNAYLVTAAGSAILVDSSVKAAWGILRRRLDGFQRRDIRLDALVLTHAHFDHAYNAAYIRQCYGARIAGSRSEAALLAQGTNAAITGSVPLTRWLTDTFQAQIPVWFRYPPVRCDLLVDERYELRAGIALLHTPGHSAGSISVIVDGEIAIAGDAVFGVYPWSAFPPFATDVGAMIHSWQKLLDTGCRLFLPGHGGAVSRGLLAREYARQRAA